MKNKLIKFLLLAMLLLAVIIIASEFISKRPDKSAPNPWEYNVDEFKQITDSSLIKYSENLNIQLDPDSLRGIAYHRDRLYIIGEKFLQVISPEGKEYYRKELEQSPRCMTVSNASIYIAYSDNIEAYDLKGNTIRKWDIQGEKNLITAIAAWEDLLFIADAGNRRVLRYKTDGEYLGYFEGKAEAGQLHGFIIPSGCFDLTVNEEGELWVVNPGKHALEHYSHDGRLLRYWENPSFGPDGFSGCCNPVHIAMLPNGSFVTSEKGIFRVKVHKPFGDLYGFVASPEKFEDAVVAPDIAVSPDGIIYLLDFSRKVVRVFEHVGG